jgi:phosphate butyryltransferase
MKSFADIHSAVRDKLKSGGKSQMAVLMPSHIEHFMAIRKAYDDAYIIPIFIGDRNSVKSIAIKAGIDLNNYEVIDSSNPITESIRLVIDGKANLLFNGGIPVRELANYISKKESGFISEGNIATHIAAVQTSRYHKLMFITDAAVIQSPDVAQKVAIIENSAGYARRLGIPRPKVALLAAVEAIYPAVPVTMEEAAIAKMGERGQIKDIIIDGPLSFDCAINIEIAQQKGIKSSPVAGDPDIFMGPSMETAHGIYKAMVMYANVAGGSVIFGGKAPIACGFEVDSVNNIFNSIAMAILAA